MNRDDGNPDFVPCAIYFEDQRCTELLIRDTTTVWVAGVAFDLGYDVDGNLIAVRMPGDVTRRSGDARGNR